MEGKSEYVIQRGFLELVDSKKLTAFSTLGLF